MSIQSEINRIAGAKSDIADAIEDQGVTVPSGTKLDGMANLIGQISGGSGKLNSTQAADAYDPTATYAVGDKVSYAGNVYSCISAISTPEAWDSTHWDQVDPIQDQVDEVRNTLTQLGTEVDTVENGLAIPQTGNACSRDSGIPVSAFIFLQGHSTLADGIYQNTSGSIIAKNADFTNSNLTRCYQDTGALNTLNNKINTLIKTTQINVNLSQSGAFDIADLPRSKYVIIDIQPVGITTGGTITFTKGVWHDGSLYTCYAYDGGTVMTNTTITIKVIYAEIS